jgi:Gpi18-like mannosyltransferase
MKRNLLFIFFAAFIFRFVLAFTTWHIDVANHMDWGIRFWQYGPSKFYSPEANVWNFTWPNQPPGTILTFAVIRKFYEFVFGVFWFFNVRIAVFPSFVIPFLAERLYPVLLKLPSILSDLGIAWLIYKTVLKLGEKDRSIAKKALAGAVVWLINPVVWYNSAVWGQTDAVINFLALLSFYYLLIDKKQTLSVISMALCFYFKASLLIFLPVYLFVLIAERSGWLSLIKSFLAAFLSILIPTLLFSKGNPIFWLFNLYKDRVFGNQLQVITANAYNFWAVLTGIEENPQNLFWGPLTYQLWGIILFLILLLPVLALLLKKRDLKNVYWSLATIAFTTFMFLTNMHERYLYPLFPVLTILAVFDIRLFYIYISISVINFINLYNFWWVPRLDILVNLLSGWGKISARVLGAFGLLIYASFYLKFLRLLRLARI